MELMSVAQTSTEHYHIATNIFRRKYSDFKISISLQNWSGRKYSVDMSLKLILINDLQMFSDLLNVFQNYIRNIDIWNRPNCSVTANQIVNEFGSETITKLQLGIINKEILCQFSVPFKNVDMLAIEIHTDIDGIKLSELFPNLRKLHIKVLNEANYDFIDCKFPHLEDLNIAYSNLQEWKRNENIIGLMKKNPQIRSVNAVTTPSKFIEVVNELLPNVEHLKFVFNDHRNKPLHFESVKHSVLYSSPIGSIKNLTFSNLELFEITYASDQLNKYTDFFRKHRNLGRLHLTEVWGTTLDLERLTAGLPNLVEVIVGNYSGTDIGDISKFIQNHQKLLKFQFSVQKMSETDRKIIYESFEHDWHIKSIVDDKHTFVFEKREKKL